MIQIVIVDDHKIIRDGISALLQDESDIEVIGEADNGLELMELFTNKIPNVVLMDINMPGMDGYEATVQLTEKYPSVQVLVLSMFSNENYINKMFSAGAQGYVLKSIGKEELTHAIRCVATGQKYVSTDISLQLLSKVSQPRSTGRNPLTDRNAGLTENKKHLTPRETEILKLIAEGYTNAEMADMLFTSKRTIETHRQNIMDKLQAKNTATLIKYAITQGIV